VRRIRSILQEIQENASVRVVDFLEEILFDAVELCSFLDTAVHVRGLELSFLRTYRLGARGARDVAEVLRRNANITTLSLVGIGYFLDTVLEELTSNICRRNLVIRWSSFFLDGRKEQYAAGVFGIIHWNDPTS